MRRLIILLPFFLLLGCSIGQTSGEFHAIRLLPGQDLKLELDKFVESKQIKAASIVSAVGSLTDVALRFANQSDVSKMKGHFELVSLSGILSSVGGSHIHMAVSDGSGKTLGGHVKEGNIIYTTMELVLIEYPRMVFKREKCPQSGYHELKVY